VATTQADPAKNRNLTYNPRMWRWLAENKQWVFSGVGLTEN
jgi:hypothetical protein